jgi:AbrB family transcriptional regulator (stage V sporulation protein T)
MKATGVVRRIDDLGRIVIPKEIRRSLRIREGDSLEIYSEGNDSIVLRKYSAVESIDTFAVQYADAIYTSSKKEVIITDSEKVIAAAGGFRKDIIGKKIDIKLDEKIQKRNLQIFAKNENLEVTENLVIKSAAILKPITVYGDIIGCVIIIGDATITDVEKVLVETSAAFLSKYLES